MLSPTPIIVAHRGLHSEHPENSCKAYHAAIDAGCDWAECDVWESADGEAIVIHDPTLDRTTTGQGAVSAMDWQALSRLALRDDRGEIIAQSRLPRLNDLPTKQISLYIEVKPANAQRLVHHVIDIMKTSDRPWVLQSFDPINLFHALAYDSSTLAELLVGDKAMLQIATKEKFRSVNIDAHLLDANTRDVLRANGCRVGVWTVNTEWEMRRVIDLGVEVLITDEPLLAGTVLKSLR